MVLEEIQAHYKRHGIDIDKVVEEEKALLELCKEKRDYSTASRIVQSWRDSLDLKPAQMKYTESLQISSKDFTSKLVSAKKDLQITENVSQSDASEEGTAKIEEEKHAEND